MKLTTWDLHLISQCPKKWLAAPEPFHNEDSLVRKLLKRMILQKALNRKNYWSFKEVARLWDEIFWEGRDITQENIDLSAKGILAARKLYSKIELQEWEPSSALELDYQTDSSVQISSVGDFVLTYKDRIETWVYGSWSHKEMRRSILPAAEHFLIQKRVRAAHTKPFYIVVYRATMRGRNPNHLLLNVTGSEYGNEKMVLHLTNVATKKISIPVMCDLCNKCEVDC